MPRTILVVDDDEMMLSFLSTVLREEGHRVAEAKGGREALAALSTGEFDLVVTDFRMPDLSGLSLKIQCFPHLVRGKQRHGELLLVVPGLHSRAVIEFATASVKLRQQRAAGAQSGNGHVFRQFRGWRHLEATAWGDASEGIAKPFGLPHRVLGRNV